MDSGALPQADRARGFFAMIGILIVLAAIVFGLERFTPADPVHVMLGANASPATIAAMRHQLGYDKPLPQQFVKYLDDLAHGNMQMSLRTRRPVTTDLADYLPATIELALDRHDPGRHHRRRAGSGDGVARARLGFRAAGAARARVRAAVLARAARHPLLLPAPRVAPRNRAGRRFCKRPDRPDQVARRRRHPALASGTWSSTRSKHLVLPALCVAFVPACSIARVLRSSLVGTMKSDHVRTARAKGLRESTVVREHALRNSVGPGAVDGRAAGRIDVRGRDRRGRGVCVARHRHVHRAEHPAYRLPGHRRRHARCSARSTSSSTPWSTSARPSPTPRIAF